MPHRLRTSESISVIGVLRATVPRKKRFTFPESLRIAERQANQLLDIRGISNAPTPIEIISELPKIAVEYTSQLVYGASFWDTNRQSWIIHLPHSEPPEHNRFTLAHEFKHIIDHGQQGHLYRGTTRTDSSAQAEQAADYFAGCLLVPRKDLKALWESGVTSTGELAELFQVSEYTIGTRLRVTGLADRKHMRHLPDPVPYIDDDSETPPRSDRSPHPEEGAILA